MSKRLNKTRKKRINVINTNRKRNIAIAIIIAICLFVIYKINFLTKSESTVPTINVKFSELDTKEILESDIELKEDENGTYIELPNTVQGIYVQKFYDFDKEDSKESFKQNDEKLQNNNVKTDSIDKSNTITDNKNDVLENTVKNDKNTNTTIENIEKIGNNNEKIENTNQVKNSNLVNEITTNDNLEQNVDEKNLNINTISKNANKLSSSENDDNNLHENKDDKLNELTAQLNENTNSIHEKDINEDLTNKVENVKVENTQKEDIKENSVEKNTSSVQESKLDNETTKEEKTTEEKPNENNINSNFDENDGLISKNDRAYIENVSYNPGDKIYLDEETLKNDTFSMQVQYSKIVLNGTELYKKDLISTDDYAEIKVTGFVPKIDFITAEKKDNLEYEKLIEDVEEFENSSILLAYDIKITDGEKIFQPKDYDLSVNVSITSKSEFENKLQESKIQVIHVKEDENQITFEKVELENKDLDSVEVITNEFSTYIVTATSSSVSQDQVYIYDYDQDRNYFIGKNSTDEFYTEINSSGTVVDNPTYSDDNLKEVYVNYYSYDYSFDLNNPLKEEKALTEISTSSTTVTRGQSYRMTYIMTFKTDKDISADSAWDVYFYKNETDNIDINSTITDNNGKINNVTVGADNKVVLSNSKFENFTKTGPTDGNYTYKITINIRYSASSRPAYLTKEAFKVEYAPNLDIGYTDNVNRQTLYTYDKCVYVNNGQISIELIDNPFMDRPAGLGFNGWKTKESNYTILTNSNTFEQTLNVSLSNIQDENGKYVINLYPNWAPANIIFLDATNGNNNNDGKSLDKPVKTIAEAKTKLSADAKTTTSVSNRELNIVVLKNGTITIDNNTYGTFQNMGCAYTITSLYNGVSYLDDATLYFNRRDGISMANDFQMDFIHAYSNYTYQNNDGTGDINYCLYGTGHNIRIGRGCNITGTDNYTTFSQIQGYPSSSTSFYKMVIESGKYSNIQMGRADSTTGYTACGIMVLGSDFDRANSVNSNLQVYYRTSSRTNSATNNGINGATNGLKYLGKTISPQNKICYVMIVKSGSFGMTYFENNTDEDRAYAGIYLGGHGSSGKDTSDRYMIVEGGNIANIIGGLQTSDNTLTKTAIYVKGGNVQNIVGGAGVTQTYGDRAIQVTGGEIAYSVSGGSNGYAASTSQDTGNNGRLKGKTTVYIGGNAQVGTAGITNSLYNVQAGCVLGGGNGANGRTYGGNVSNSHVVIDGNAIVYNNVYAAGNYGFVGTSTPTAGTITQPQIPQQDVVEFVNNNGIDTNKEYLISSANNGGNALTDNNGNFANTVLSTKNLPQDNTKWILENAGNGKYYIKNAQTGNYLYYKTGQRIDYEPTTVNYKSNGNYNQYLNGTYYKDANGITQINSISCTTATLGSFLNWYIAYTWKINGDEVTSNDRYATSITIYHKKTTNTTASGLSQTEKSEFTLNANNNGYQIYTTISGTKYALRFNNNQWTFSATSQPTLYLLTYNELQITLDDSVEETSPSTISSFASKIDINGGTVNVNVYGGGNQNGIDGNMQINMKDGKVIGAIYGGPNVKGTVSGSTEVNITGGTVSEETKDDAGNIASKDSVFVGGKGSATTINGQAVLKIFDTDKNVDILGSIYGGSEEGKIIGKSYIYIEDHYSDANIITLHQNVFGGGKGVISGNTAENGNNVQVIVNGLNDDLGLVKVFGGCNLNGRIYGTILVNIGKTYNTIVNEVYGGGNKSAVTLETKKDLVNLFDKAKVNSAFNGGNEAGIVGTQTQTTRKINVLGAEINLGVYGGSNTSGTLTETHVYCSNEKGKASNHKIANVYGGGKGQDTVISSNTNVVIENNCEITSNVYGGGDQGIVKGDTFVNILGSTVKGNAYGGGNGDSSLGTDKTKFFGCVNGNTNIILDVFSDNNEENSEVIKTVVEGNVFGGGEGITSKVDKNTNLIIQNDSIVKTNAYGGGNQGSVTGNTYVTLQEATVEKNLYGGGNGSNTAYTDNDIVIKQGSVNGTTNVTITTKDEIDSNTIIATVKENVYGGGQGNTAEVFSTNNIDINNSKVILNVYGGGNAGDVNEPTVNIENSEIGNNVYGGGQAAAAKAGTNINFRTSTAYNIYGGGENGIVGDIASTDLTNLLTQVFVENQRSIENVYGGGKGTTAIVYGGTSVEIADTTVQEDRINYEINDSVYGGGDAGEVKGSTYIAIYENNIKENVFGGGNAANVNLGTNVNLYGCHTKNVFGGGNQGKVGIIENVADVYDTYVSLNVCQIDENVYGGGNQGDVGGQATVMVSNKNYVDYLGNSYDKVDERITESIFGGGKAADVGSSSVNLSNEALAKNVFGGGDQGQVLRNTNVTITESNIEEEVFGGGNGAETATDKFPGSVGQNTNVNISKDVTVKNVFGGGKGITAFVNGNTNVKLEDANVTNDVYGGGDNGSCKSSTFVSILSSKINGNAFGAGNGAPAAVLGSSYISIQGNTEIEKSVYGGGNNAPTGIALDENSSNVDMADNAKTIVDITGGLIKENVFGGANTSIINGTTYVNIGKDAVLNCNEQTVNVENYVVGNIKIGTMINGLHQNNTGTIYGGGYSPIVGEELTSWDESFYSVTKAIYINIDAAGYDQIVEIPSNDPNVQSTQEEIRLEIYGSVFGSGNASNAAQDGYVTVKNFGQEANNRKKMLSFQRCTTLTIDNSVLMLSGIKDSTSNYKETPFTFNKIADLQLKNNSILYLGSGANRLSKYESLNADGSYATVTINDRDYSTNASSDNRIYMSNGVNLNVCTGDPKNYEVGPVKGMTFFGMYKSATSGSSDPDGINKGIYDQNYNIGGDIPASDWDSRDFLRTYVLGEHSKNPEQDITKDGFYSNFEELDLENGYDYGNISQSHYKAKSYTTYINTTPQGDFGHYFWYIGPEQDVIVIAGDEGNGIELVASKFSTMGAISVGLSMDERFTYQGATLTMTGIDSADLHNTVTLTGQSLIPNINTNEQGPTDANHQFALAMKTSNGGWSMNGHTKFYRNNYEGTEKYELEYSNNLSSLNFYLYHSNNITENNDFGIYTVNMNLEYWKDALNKGTAKVIIKLRLKTAHYEGIGYNAAITSGMQYDLIAGSTTKITTKSSFSTFYEMGEADAYNSFADVLTKSGITFDAGNPTVQDYYENSYRVISSGNYVFPANTTITMIDRYDSANPEFYYYIVTEDDERNRRTEFRLSDFLAMDSLDKHYSEAEMRKKYINADGYLYENFIYIVNFEGANFDDEADNSKITPDNTYFEMELRTPVVLAGENTTIALAKLINDQIGTIEYSLYKSDSSIGVNATLSKNKIYLGNDLNLNVITSYNANIGADVFDTRYFDKKMGVKITLYLEDENGDYNIVEGGTMLGTNFEINGSLYYPRADGTTRIKLADAVFGGNFPVSIDTKKSSLPNGNYKIKVEVFGSADGIYFGSESSAFTEVELKIVKESYGLDSSVKKEEQVIIDSKTGCRLDSNGYISKSDNDLEFNVNYKSGYTNPYITISLYRRNYDNVYDRDYTLVDLKEYVKNDLKVPEEMLDSYDDTNQDIVDFVDSITTLKNEYEFKNTQSIKSKVSDEQTEIVFDDIKYYLKEKLTTGTYKVVFTLYDTSDVKETRYITNDDGDKTPAGQYNVRKYEKIGSTFSYIIIK